VDYADAECILPEDRGNEERQIQHQIGRRGGMQCLLCDGIRILSEAFQTTESGTQSVRESGHVTSVIPSALANKISTCLNTPVLEVLKVLPLLGVQVQDRSDYECRYKIADK
jgi:hypothetical protein